MGQIVTRLKHVETTRRRNVMTDDDADDGDNGD